MRLADDKVSKLAVSRSQLERLVRSLENRVSESTFKQMRAWWCISYAAFLRCSETAKIRLVDVVIGRNTEGCFETATVSLAVRDRRVFKTTTETIKVRLL